MKLLIFFSLIFSCVTSAEDGKLHLKSKGTTILTYNATYIPSPIKDKPFYGRSGFLHPVYTPSGKIITDDFPKSHPHQHGIMFAWTNVNFKGKKIDFWNSQKKQGRIEHAKTISGKDGSIIVELAHIAYLKDGEKTILNERWEITLIEHSKFNIFELKSTQSCATENAVTIDKYHYGALCVRGNKDWYKQVNFLTSEGKGREDGNHTKPNWVSISGPLQGARQGGLIAMSHPKNFRGPQPVRINNKVPYFCFAPMVEEGFEITPGKPYTSHFRFITFDGASSNDEIEELWQAYIKK